HSGRSGRRAGRSADGSEAQYRRKPPYARAVRRHEHSDPHPFQGREGSGPVHRRHAQEPAEGSARGGPRELTSLWGAVLTPSPGGGTPLAVNLPLRPFGNPLERVAPVAHRPSFPRGCGLAAATL